MSITGKKLKIYIPWIKKKVLLIGSPGPGCMNFIVNSFDRKNDIYKLIKDQKIMKNI